MVYWRGGRWSHGHCVSLGHFRQWQLLARLVDLSTWIPATVALPSATAVHLLQLCWGQILPVHWRAGWKSSGAMVLMATPIKRCLLLYHQRWNHLGHYILEFVWNFGVFDWTVSHLVGCVKCCPLVFGQKHSRSLFEVTTHFIFHCNFVLFFNFDFISLCLQVGLVHMESKGEAIRRQRAWPLIWTINLLDIILDNIDFKHPNNAVHLPSAERIRALSIYQNHCIPTETDWKQLI